MVALSVPRQQHRLPSTASLREGPDKLDSFEGSAGFPESLIMEIQGHQADWGGLGASKPDWPWRPCANLQAQFAVVDGHGQMIAQITKQLPSHHGERLPGS